MVSIYVCGEAILSLSMPSSTIRWMTPTNCAYRQDLNPHYPEFSIPSVMEKLSAILYGLCHHCIRCLFIVINISPLALEVFSDSTTVCLNQQYGRPGWNWTNFIGFGDQGKCQSATDLSVGLTDLSGGQGWGRTITIGFSVRCTDHLYYLPKIKSDAYVSPSGELAWVFGSTRFVPRKVLCTSRHTNYYNAPIRLSHKPMVFDLC